MKIKSLTVVAAVVLLGAVAAPAVSARGAEETEVTIRSQGGDFSGAVRSADANCEDGRKVNVFRKRSGKDDKIATDTADDKGKWSTGNNGQDSGKFYAKAPKNPECLKGKSETITL